MKSLPRIVDVQVRSGHRLDIQFDDGAIVTKDLNPIIAIGNLAAPLADDEFVRQVQITERRRSLLWPNGLEFCADSLRYPEESPQKAIARTKTVAATNKRSPLSHQS